MLMSRALSRSLAPAVLALLACKASPTLTVEPAPAQAAVPVDVAPTPALKAEAPATPGAPDPSLPIVGDPLGLLSRPAPRAKTAAVKEEAKGFDPGALMASTKLAPPTQVPLERDPRAVARGAAAMSEAAPKPRSSVSHVQGPIVVQEKSAAEVIGGVKRSAQRPHVLLLYAAYCRACRNVLPNFLPLVEYYRPRGVLFTAASVDADANAYESYAPVLKGILPPVLIRSEGQTLKELQRAGLSFSGNGYSIPLVAVFDRSRKLVKQGGSGEIARLAQTLDTLDKP